ncbi:MAG: rRNA maturation RNase YbeY [Chloroflexi bacterium]|nr:rRNA maturation RNase YbeY [Chloroflexota bacterium]
MRRIASAIESTALVSGAKLQASVRFVSPCEMAHLHHYKGGEGPTNVLTFAYMTGADIAICLQVAERDSLIRGWDLLSELTYLCIHGCLHALGFDHSDPARAFEMGRLERHVLAKLGQNSSALDP